MADPEALLRAARVVGLVDWQSPAVPRALLSAGLEVVSFNRLRNTANAHAWYPTRDQVPAGDDVTLLDSTDGCLACRPAPPPASVDILNVFRPPDELPELARLAVHLGAKALWLQPGRTSPEARQICEAGGVAYVEEVDIATTAGRPSPPTPGFLQT